VKEKGIFKESGPKMEVDKKYLEFSDTGLNFFAFRRFSRILTKLGRRGRGGDGGSEEERGV
jgi:hypothetical protein